MRNITLTTFLLVIGLFQFLPAISAQAATLDYTYNSDYKTTDWIDGDANAGPLEITKFNESLGDLITVDVLWEYDIESTISMANSSGVAQTGKGRVETTFSLTSFGNVPNQTGDMAILETAVQTVDDGVTWTSALLSSESNSNYETSWTFYEVVPGHTTPWKGTGVVTGDISTDTEHWYNGSGNMVVTSTNTARGKVTVTYTYTPSNPIPEPATMILFGGGLLGIAGIGRRKFMANR